VATLKRHDGKNLIEINAADRNVYMQQWSIDAGAFLAMLSAERALPGAALLS
jgi:hypothetical protein